MPLIVRDLGNLVMTSSTVAVTNAVHLLDDAGTIGLFNQSTCTTGSVIQVAHEQDEVISSAQSTGWPSPPGDWHTLLYPSSGGSTMSFITSDHCLIIPNIPFRWLRIQTTAGYTSGTLIAIATKQITV